MVPVSRLPDPILLALFKQMTPKDQLIARRVCSQWHDLIPDATIHRNSLSLLFGHHSRSGFSAWVNQYIFDTKAKQYLVKEEDGTPLYTARIFTKFNSLQIITRSDQISKQIVATFTAITSLELAADASGLSAPSLLYILTAWRHQLITFKLTYDLWSSDIAAPFWNALNGFTALKHLTLFLGCTQCPILPILSRLEVFIFRSHAADQPHLLTSLQIYAQLNPTLREVELHTHFNNLKQLLRLSPHLRSSITSLSNIYRPDRLLVPIVGHFTSLTTLSITLATNLSHLFATLSHLTRLANLRLDLNLSRLIVDDEFDFPLCQLPSVKSLRLHYIHHMEQHEQLLDLQLEWTMPNVQVISVFIRNSTCSTCAISPFLIEYCPRSVFAYWKRKCAQLRTVLCWEREIVFSADELVVE